MPTLAPEDSRNPAHQSTRQNTSIQTVRGWDSNPGRPSNWL